MNEQTNEQMNWWMNESQNRSSHILSSSSRFTDVEEAYIVGHLHVSDVLNEFLKTYFSY